jgi:hypothetical protein
MTTYTWGSTTGYWSTAGNWTPNGGPPNAATDQADITTAGAYTVTVDASTTFLLDALVLNDASAELDVQGTLDFAGVDNTLALDAGTLLLDSGGVIQGATIQADGGTLAGNDGTLNGVTWQGALHLPDSTTVTVEDGLTVETAAGGPGGTIVVGNDSTLNVSGGLTVGDAGSPGSIELARNSDEIFFTDSETLDDAAVTISGTSDFIDAYFSTLTLGADTTVDLSGSGDGLYDSITNLGSIGVTGGYSYFSDQHETSTFDNQGSLSVGNATLTVSNSTFTNEGSITVGSGGVLDISSPNAVTNSGTVTVESGGEIELSSPLTNTGTIIIESGATVDLQGYVTLADLQAAGITIQTGVLLEISGTLDLQGGTMEIASSGAFSDVLIVGGGTIANGTIFSDGGTLTLQYATLDAVTYRGDLDIAASSSLTTEGGLTVESAAGTLPGTIVVDYGASLYVTGGITVGTGATSGSIELTDNYASIIFSDSETLDDAAVTISGTSDFIDAYFSTLTLGADTTVDLSGNNDALYDSITNLGSIGVTGGNTYFEDRYETSTFDNQGSLSVSDAAVNVYNSTFTNEGSIDVGSGGYLDVDSTTFTSSGSLVITSGGTLEIHPVTSAAITYHDPANVILDDPSGYTGTLSGFSVGDTLQLDGEDVASASIIGTTLTVYLVGNPTPLTYNTGPGLSGTNFSITNGTDGYHDLLTVTCFLAGTRILTEHGEVAVEDLREGDRVATPMGTEGMQPVRWIGRRRIDTAAHPRPEACRPIRIRQDAIATGKPHRDLLVSPDHAILLDGVLIPAKLLVNGMTIVPDDSIRHVDYFHVELDRHAILLAEGLEAESYLDTGNRAIFENAGLAMILHPTFPVERGVSNWEEHACATLAVAPDVVGPVWRHLAARAAGLGFAPPPPPEATSEPDLRLVVDGRVLRPVEANAGRAVFALPRGARAAVLGSRAASPAAFEPFHEDRRRLGVAVKRLRAHLAGAERMRDIALDGPGLATGWWAAEAAPGVLWRWTDGAAHVKLPEGARLLEVALHGTHRYPVAQDAAQDAAAA